MLAVLGALVRDALGGAAVIGLAAVLWDQVYRRARFLWFSRITGTYDEVTGAGRSIEVKYIGNFIFRADCRQGDSPVWISTFGYDPKTRLATGSYRYVNGVNPDDWGEHRLYFVNGGDVRVVDRNFGAGKDAVHTLQWARRRHTRPT